MLLLPIAEKQGLFLQESRRGLVITLLPTDFFFFFFLHWWEEVLLSPQPRAGEPQSVVVIDLLGPANDSQVGVRPVQTPDGWLGASSSVERGMCVVDGSIHYIGCWHFWGWGGSALWYRPCQAASYCGGLVELWLSLLKRCLGPFPPSLLVSTCRVCATGTQEIPTEMSTEQFYNFPQQC